MRLDRCRADILAELEQMATEMAKYEPLLRKVQTTPPDTVEISATAVLLHSFYNGLENMLRTISREIDEDSLMSAGWHRELLERMGQATAKRPAVISPELLTLLVRYLGFRHIFRHSYAFQFSWEKMHPLVAQLELVSVRFREEITAFLATMKMQ